MSKLFSFFLLLNNLKRFLCSCVTQPLSPLAEIACFTYLPQRFVCAPCALANEGGGHSAGNSDRDICAASGILSGNLSFVTTIS